ncbi:carbon-nitrogen family hydrolase [Nocardioides maradonensis]
MTSLVRLALVQVGYGDDETLESRVDRVTAQLDELADVDLVVLPELWAHGGFASDRWAAQAQPIDGALVRRLREVAARRGFWLHGGSIIESAPPGADRGREGRGLWNTSVLIGLDGELHATYRKIHRFGFGDGEPRLLEAGTELAVADLEIGHGDVRAGLATCYDLRFPELFRALLDRGVGLVLVPAAWPLPRVEHWRLLGRARAVEDQVWIVQCNTAGRHAGLTMGGHSQVVSPTGEVVAELDTDEGVLLVDIDLDLIGETRAGFPVHEDRRLRSS